MLRVELGDGTGVPVGQTSNSSVSMKICWINAHNRRVKDAYLSGR